MWSRATGATLGYMLVCLVTFILIPMPGSAQETAPVTVIIQFEQPAVEAFGGSGGGNLGAATISAAGVTSFTLFNQVVLPRVETKTERDAKQDEIAQRLPRRPRTLGGTFRYENVDFDNPASGLNGNLYSTNLQMAWDIENFSLGFLVPYEYLDLRRFDANLVGTILYGQYNLRINPVYTAGFTLNGNYIYTAIDSNFENINTYGGGVGLSLSMDRDIFVISGAFSYQYNRDDSNSENNHQHLVKIGAHTGVRIHQNSTVNLFSTWNYDITDYRKTPNVTDDNYFDLGIEASWSITRSWNLNGGYKRILGLKDLESNQFFIGTLLRF